MRDQSRRRAFFDASLVTPDQMPLVQILRWRALLSVGRVCGPDLMFALCEHLLGYGSTHFFYGAAAGVPDRLVAHQRGLFEELKNCGRLVTFIARNDRMQQSEGYSPRQCQWCGCRLGWVGLGGPKQERWSADHRKEFLTRLLVGAGYAFDALSGIKPQAPPPVWLRESGFEWALGFAPEPARRRSRVFIDGALFLAALAGRILGVQRFIAAPRNRQNGKFLKTTNAIRFVFASSNNSDKLRPCQRLWNF